MKLSTPLFFETRFRWTSKEYFMQDTLEEKVSKMKVSFYESTPFT